MTTEVSEVAEVPDVSVEDQKKRVDEAIERLDRLAESELEMARLFISKGKKEIARRRLRGLIETYSKSHVVKDAKALLKTIR